MSKSFWLANYFASANLGLESTTRWTKYEFDDFKFSKILSGDRFVFFVCSDTNRLVEFTSKPRSIADNSMAIKIKKKSNVFDSLLMETDTTPQEVKHVTGYYINDLMGNPKKIQYRMGGGHIFLLEKTRIGIIDYIETDPKFKIEDYSSFGGINKFFCGPLSSHHVVLTNDRRVFVNNQQFSLNTKESPTIIKLAACCGSGVVLASDKHLYARGDNTFNVFTSVNNDFSSSFFEKIPFEFPANIKDVKCGFFHTIVLLENNQIFGCGYNTLKQSTFGIADAGIDSLSDFRLIEFDFGIPKEIACSSRGTVVINTNGDVFMAGEVVSDFPPSELKLNPSLFKFNITTFDREEFNTISVGGWQYVIYYEIFDETRKGELHMKRNLGSLLSTKALSDLVIIIDV
ncbi:predicted protein [Naegleria gruberi]|uniref:Predicted protein n=1 Tax=Naegleria gruberi TaxID=5762 RepID=D2VWT1_NAEGR|nr:uncharacterized protein NAEGRDRAFT_73492 [Naegleria gruberi]EFC38749.1 predicted protein [Naegleria gruberi]|eukprot:XP_002671493.1 predicted protein [Naegleria gruberi strain NEG-M]